MRQHFSPSATRAGVEAPLRLLAGTGTPLVHLSVRLPTYLATMPWYLWPDYPCGPTTPVARLPLAGSPDRPRPPGCASGGRRRDGCALGVHAGDGALQCSAVLIGIWAIGAGGRLWWRAGPGPRPDSRVPQLGPGTQLWGQPGGAQPARGVGAVAVRAEARAPPALAGGRPGRAGAGAADRRPLARPPPTPPITLTAPSTSRPLALAPARPVAPTAAATASVDIRPPRRAAPAASPVASPAAVCPALTAAPVVWRPS